MSNLYPKPFCLAVLIILLFYWPAHAVPSAPWPVGHTINAFDRSPRAPSMAAFGGSLYMAWKAEGASHRIFIAWSSDGINWSRGLPINNIDGTPEAPALVASPGRLYIAFKGSDGSIYVAWSANPTVVWGPAHRVSTPDRTTTAPAVTYFNGKICLAWSSYGTNQLYFLATGESFWVEKGLPISRWYATPKSPSLASWHGKLYLAWKSPDPSNRIFIASSPDGRNWSSARPINGADATSETPVLFSTPHRLYLAFKSNDSFNTIHLTSVSDPDLEEWPAAININSVDSTPLAPAVSFYQNKLFLAWKANDPTDRLFITSSYAQESEFFFKYLGTYPDDTHPGWHDEAQGLAHDRNNWFITQRDTLWKVPVEVDLNHIFPRRRGVRRSSIADYPPLSPFNHFGDPDYLEVDGRGYVVVPMQGEIEDARLTELCEAMGLFGFCPSAFRMVQGIALFNSDNLEYVAHATAERGEMGWCAVDHRGRLYAREVGRDDSILRYDVDWHDLIRRATEARTRSGTVLAYVIRPSLSLRLASPANYGQGGEVSPSGELLYLVADGIHVIDLTTGQRLIESSNGYGIFNFAFTLSEWPNPYTEPEGLTLWDLDDGRAPNIRGQLHVLILDNDVSEDEILIKHYSVGSVDQPLDLGSSRVVDGSVFDDLSRRPIDADIRVFLGPIEVGHATAKRGTFSIYDLPNGSYRVVARASGRESESTRPIFVHRRLLSPGSLPDFLHSRWELRVH